jgi:hypothetical protein
MVALNWTDRSVVADGADGRQRRTGTRPTGKRAPSARARSSASNRSSASDRSSASNRSSGSPRLSRPAHPSSLAHPSGWASSPVYSRSAAAWRSTGQSPLPGCPAPVLPASGRPHLTLVRDTPKRAPQPRSRSDAASRRRNVFLWRRMLVVVLIAGLGAAALAAGGWLVQAAGAQPSRSPVEHVYVAQPGDTIWGIAVKFSGSGDPRPLAEELGTQIGGGVLQPGEQLTIP